MTVKWRKINNALHRDIGYFFFGMTIIYAISGIALNHIDDWDPSYRVDTRDVKIDVRQFGRPVDERAVVGMLDEFGVGEKYKKHYFPGRQQLKVFLDDGTLTVDMVSGRGLLETVKRRPVLFEMNYLHYNNPRFLWTWFSDIYAVALVVMAVTGLFVLRGRNGFKRRGVWFVLVGVFIPAIFLVMYYAGS